MGEKNGEKNNGGNKKAREKLIQIFGSECFIDKLKVRTGNYMTTQQYQKLKKLTFHHIKKKSEGGPASIENRCCFERS